MKDLEKRLGERFFTYTNEDGVPTWQDCPVSELGELSDFIETLLQEERERVVEEIIDFVQQESGKSGRKEIIEYLKSKKREEMKEKYLSKKGENTVSGRHKISKNSQWIYNIEEGDK